MRILDEFVMNGCRISLLSWNNRYIIKLEQGWLEQVFKIDQFIVNNEKQLRQLLDEDFMTEASRRFELMEQALNRSLERLGPTA